jgi:hypothetical protein
VIYQPKILIVVSETSRKTARLSIRNATAISFLRGTGPVLARALSQGPTGRGSARETLNTVIEARRVLCLVNAARTLLRLRRGPRVLHPY